MSEKKDINPLEVVGEYNTMAETKMFTIKSHISGHDLYWVPVVENLPKENDKVYKRVRRQKRTILRQPSDKSLRQIMSWNISRGVHTVVPMVVLRLRGGKWHKLQVLYTFGYKCGVELFWSNQGKVAPLPVKRFLKWLAK